jgi:hypothetical protein
MHVHIMGHSIAFAKNHMLSRETMQIQVHSHICCMTWALSNGAIGKRWGWCSVVGRSVVIFPAFGGRLPHWATEGASLLR